MKKARGAAPDPVPSRAADFVRLYDCHAQAVYKFCARRTADLALAEDLTSATFLEVWRHRDKAPLGEAAAALPWLLGVANNVNSQRIALQAKAKGCIGKAPTSWGCRCRRGPRRRSIRDRIRAKRRARCHLSAVGNGARGRHAGLMERAVLRGSSCRTRDSRRDREITLGPCTVKAPDNSQ